MKIIRLAIFICLFSTSGALVAAGSLSAECTKHRFDIRSAGDVNNIEIEKALRACEIEWQNNLDDPLTTYSLAWAYYSNSRVNETISLLGRLVEQDFSPALGLLGQIYLDLAETSDDPAEFAATGVALFEEAASGGYPLSDDDWLSIWEVYFRYNFATDGYRDPGFMRVIYADEDGELLTQHDEKTLRLLLQLEEECDGIAIEDSLTLHLFLNSVRWDRQFVGNLEARSDIALELAAAIENLDDARHNLNRRKLGKVAQAVRRDYHDTTLFVLRHACDSPVFDRFVVNLNERASAILLDPKRAREALVRLY